MGGEIDSVMHPHPRFRGRCAKLTGGSKNLRREIKRRNRKPPTTASAGERIQSAPSGNAVLVRSSQLGNGVDGTRFSDEQLYALALYLYSPKPSPNPNRFDDRARRGHRSSQQQGCAGCHTPPLYTNNKLTPAPGFKIPGDLRLTDDIRGVSVGTARTRDANASWHGVL